MHEKIVGRCAVITGAGHGIGRALAARLVAEGATVVVNDLDVKACDAVAAELGAISAPGDCSSSGGISALLDSARQAHGRIDMFFANAGIDRTVPDSLLLEDEAWARMLDVNLMSHVRAARALVPHWTDESGVGGIGGRFVITSSAAALLTMIGSAPYAVTKHASIAFAEWLSVTYGSRGLVVQAICPQSVQTRMLDEGGPVKLLLPAEETLSPDQVASSWVQSLNDDRFLVLPHPQVARSYAFRATDTDKWLSKMQQLQQIVDERKQKEDQE